MTTAPPDGRIPVLYLAPWVDYGGTDKGTIDWFRSLDRDRFAPSLVTTQPSRNRRLAEVIPFAEEAWQLPDLLGGGEMAHFVFDFLHTRGVRVLHVMNSRLGYELLPDLAALPRRPKVVVQLHVEEPDRSGYVRYVTTRFGNLVDAFSVTSEHLAQAVYDYGVSRDRIHVIHTGVDAEHEFAPDRAHPTPQLAPDRVHILYPGRVVEQKDPLLMVKVAAELRERTEAFQLHVVGEGDLEQQVRREVSARHLDDHVLFHPSTDRLQSWYAACDLLLMTSVFEGVPYVVYEAMSMELPVVAPALPGNTELLGDTAGGLISPRGDVTGYADALARLVADPDGRHELARRARERVRREFSLEGMGEAHGRLYDELLGNDPPAAADGEPAAPDEEPLRFRTRRLFETPLVSVIIPCFNQGRVLRECLDSLRAQTHPRLETIVVDDASTDSETRAVMDELSQDASLTVVRLAENGGPSRARNAALERCSGRYVLPVDADNLLLPDTVERLVAQLKVAGETVGFIYPNVSYFGNRDDYFEPPDWDLYGLLQRNVCDVCSLFDREIFDAGVRFDATIRLGHEDWDFVLQLAARGVRGEPALGPVLRYRVWGFNRSESVEHACEPFRAVVRARSPLTAQEPEIKARSSPALSLVGLARYEPDGQTGRDVARLLRAQTCCDFELIARVEGELQVDGGAPVRRLPPAVSLSNAEAVVHAHAAARGRLFAVTPGTGAELLADRSFVEKVLRVFRSAQAHGARLNALVLSDPGPDSGPPWTPVDPDADVDGAHTVVMTRAVATKLGAVEVDSTDPVGSLTGACVALGDVQWRHLPLRPPVAPAAGAGNPQARRGATLLPAAPRTPGARALLKEREQREPFVLGLPENAVRRWRSLSTWVPPLSMALCRHRELGGERRVVRNTRESPPGFFLEFDLGSARVQGLVGTRRLLERRDGTFTTVPSGSREGAERGARSLGYVEEAPLPLLDALVLGIHPATGQQVLVAGPFDPLAQAVEPVSTLGFVEPFPVHPRRPAHTECTLGLVSLFRALDLAGRRHRYGVGTLPEGELLGELGALLEWPQADSVPVWIQDGRLVTARHRPPSARVTPRTAVRWAGAPMRWRGFSGQLPRARAAARRTLGATHALIAPAPSAQEPTGEPAGWLMGKPYANSVPLYAAYHPVTRDQLLTTRARYATDIGYAEPELLGHLRDFAPMTGTRELRRAGIPWASRFALAAEPA